MIANWSSAPRCVIAFQEPGLSNSLGVLDNITLGLEGQGISQSERRHRAGDILARTGQVDFAKQQPDPLVPFDAL